MKSKLQFNKRDLNNVNKILADLKIAVSNASQKQLNRASAEMVKEVKLEAPVDTGALKQAVHYGKSGSGIYIESTMNYSSFVEFGTSKQKPQPFFFNPIRKRFRKFVNELDRKIKKEIR